MHHGKINIYLSLSIHRFNEDIIKTNNLDNSNVNRAVLKELVIYSSLGFQLK